MYDHWRYGQKYHDKLPNYNFPALPNIHQCSGMHQNHSALRTTLVSIPSLATCLPAHIQHCFS